MVLMVTKIPHEYAGRMLAPGDEFACHEEHVNLLKVLGRAAEVEPEPVPAPVREESRRRAFKR